MHTNKPKTFSPLETKGTVRFAFKLKLFEIYFALKNVNITSELVFTKILLIKHLPN